MTFQNRFTVEKTLDKINLYNLIFRFPYYTDEKCDGNNQSSLLVF